MLSLTTSTTESRLFSIVATLGKNYDTTTTTTRDSHHYYYQPQGGLMDDFLYPVLHQSQSQGGSNFTFDLYSSLVAGFDGPFILIFLLTFFVALGSYVFQFKHLKRNHHVLFWMMFALSLFASFQNLTRLASELAFLFPTSDGAFHLNNVIKGIDRSMSAVLLYTQILILGFIAYIFMKTTRATGDISERTYKISVVSLIVTLILFFILFMLGHVMVIVILHAMRGSKTITGLQTSQLTNAIFTSPMIFMSLGLATTAVFLNAFGFRLYISLRQRKKKIKEMLKNTMNLTLEMNSPRSNDGDKDSTNISNTFSTTNNNNEATNTTIHTTTVTTDLSNQTPGTPSTSASPTVGFIIPKSNSKHVIQNEVMDQKNKKNLSSKTKDFSETYHLKKHALRKTLGLQIGLSIAFFIQLIGLGFLPGALGWQFSLLFYHNFSNFAQLSFVIILLIIFNPLKEVQRLFEKAPNFLNNDSGINKNNNSMMMKDKENTPIESGDAANGKTQNVDLSVNV
ncbi:hypothetical protein C9374_014607 [Naegleria lovaniensis]|uniref:Uncharacterized protein n=1 Tax=Naegleria lovaniensis TaxID=51637 RepID=A0AA88GY45_NAELO|nr:uncharacterized protein C9374_014607 [Naegleria lovaniensis]KAG2389207.1 hypothetical protein C9374_014607 [Naegleria lovaniensis]